MRADREEEEGGRVGWKIGFGSGVIVPVSGAVRTTGAGRMIRIVAMCCGAAASAAHMPGLDALQLQHQGSRIVSLGRGYSPRCLFPERQKRVALGAAEAVAHLLAPEKEDEGERQAKADRESDWNDIHKRSV